MTGPAPKPISSSRSVRNMAASARFVRCLPNSYSVRHRSLRTILITAKVRRWLASAVLLRCRAPCRRRARPAATGAPLDEHFEQARCEQAAAEAETVSLERAASAARGEANRLHAEQAAAAQAVEAAEARITAADARLALLRPSLPRIAENSPRTAPGCVPLRGPRDHVAQAAASSPCR